MLLISEADARDLVTLGDAIAVVEAGFAALSRGEAIMFPPLVGHGSDPANRFGAKAGVDRAARRPGIKIGSYWGKNPERGLAAHASTTVLLDDETGRPAAIVSAGYLNALRTAAADAVAVRWLARPDAHAVALVGAGHQAAYDLAAIRRVRTIDQVRVWSRDPSKAERLARDAAAEGLDVRATSLEEAVRSADIVVTATASREPLVRRAWIQPGAHISAMGADGRGKQELEIELAASVSAFADLPEQSAVIGEFQHAVLAGRLAPDAIRAIGDVIVGAAPGRGGPEDITAFDSSGVAMQDIAVAALAVDRARASGRGLIVNLDTGAIPDGT
ncbi:ornithine cyclodeaminase family protein [Phenylobacterium aquaticum]|uniref:ornithine cyclodeaminase family protein n=1 Tax=Phenylobacterium aquaticum TaxID=1763816 RepID=UPI001F5C3CB0|nr:ornithine cyclodeaminase family protein [Phenylobacterium aquaticum]MCI3131182.1 ornithine cyclodeaminase family protein [Phenylobacterium aquaticum]